MLRELRRERYLRQRIRGCRAAAVGLCAVLASVVPRTAAADAPWYDPLWTMRDPITIAGSTAGAQTNYPVKIPLAWSSGMKADFSDLRFTDSGGTQLLSYWIESETDSSTALVWVKVPAIPASPGAITIYVYYGNPAAAGLSNGDTTFTLFDTFGAGGTPGDWNYTNNIIGEHAIIHNGKLYAPLYDSDFGVNGGLVVLNPTSGSVIKHFKIPGLCTAAAPAFDRNGYLHIYDCVGFIKKLDENTGTVLQTLNIGDALDWESLPYDPVNDIILIGSQSDHSLRAVRASDYSVVWRNTDVDLTYGTSEIDPPLIVGGYVYWQDYSGRLLKISLSTGVTAASTSATAAGLPAVPYAFVSYSQIIYDAGNNRLYLTNSNGHTAFAVNPGDLSVIWSKVVESAGWNFNRGGAYHDGVWYVTARESSYPYRSKIYALNTQNSGSILWTNTTAYDNGAEVSSLLADNNYVYAGLYDYVDQDYKKLLILSALDGSVASNILLLNGVASSIPNFYGGKIIMGLWNDTSGQQVGGYQALQVRDGGGKDDFYYKADLSQTGYVGAFANGPLTARTACAYGSLDPTRWIATGIYSITNCMAVSTVNDAGWSNYFKSSLTFSRSNTAIRVRAKNAEPTSDSWDAFAGFTSTMGTCLPVCFGRNNGQMVLGYDQNGSPQFVGGPSYSFDQYSTSEVKMAYPSLQFDVNDSNVVSIQTWSTGLDNRPIQIGNYKGTAAVDWVLVRNYVNPEPVVVKQAGSPALTVFSTHAASFTQGQDGAIYRVTVSNAGTASTSGTVVVTDATPAGMTLVSMAGPGWTCGGNTCTTGNPLNAGASYPPITVTVNVASNAGTPLLNSVTVSGGGSATNSSGDSTIVLVNPPVLRIAKGHTGDFRQGQNEANYIVAVSNSAGAGTTNGIVTVTEVLPVGLALVSMAGTGWTCGGNTCTNGSVLAGGESYPAITVTVNVAGNAPAQVTNQVNVAGGGGSAPAAAVDPTTIAANTATGALQFVPVTPCRVMDTRNPTGPFGGPFVAGGTTRTIPIPSSVCAVPPNAAAYSLNITVVPRTGALGYLSVWPTGQAQPAVSTLNSPDGSILANGAIVAAGAGGSINAFASNDTELIVDMNGYFVPPAAGALQFYPVTPCRVLDTRNAIGTFGGPSLAGGTGRSFPVLSSACGVPAAAAYSLNVTVVPHGPLGYLTTWPTGQAQPGVSTLNSLDGTILANAAIVPAGSNGAVSFYASNTTDVVVDINGYFASPGTGGLNFYLATPCRIVDTRNAAGDFGGPMLRGGVTRAFPLSQGSCGLTATPAAYSLNMTVVPSGALGYLTTWAAGRPQPFVSTLNASKGQVAANAAIVPAGTNGAVNVFASNATDIIIDTNGYFAP